MTEAEEIALMRAVVVKLADRCHDFGLLGQEHDLRQVAVDLEHAEEARR